ncbi:glycosyltransferase family 39 protein [Saccharopolyspora hirsuta]|uniref:Glycosyltransferase family 39 protein n=1 Tax=Saccharopolyspora hirsuta TaxID=1837 RepID=A0A5M7CC69_SACHI|nr:glycosyltransferase family 39 protein [Saccharopolyspora hirsuta]KAA5837304.1 glycosyltransferase family 39 protein [Saccharopolyspora hirsuta]
MEPAVLAAQPRPPAEPWLRPLAKWPVLTIAGLVAVAHLVLSAIGDFWIDEAYMLAAGKYHPDWGYADQPPFAPLIAAAMDWIAPGSLVVLRLPAVLATAAAVVMCALLARELGGDRRAQVLAAGAGATGLWVGLVGHWVTPYTFEPVQWLVLSWLLVRWIRLREQGRPDDRLLLVFGVVLGVAAQTKFQVAILCVALLISVLLVGPREILRRPMFWGGVGIAAVIAAPTLVWQALHGWPQLQMGAIVAEESPILSGGRGGTAVMLVLYAGVAGAALYLIGLWKLFRSAELRPYRFFGLAAILLHVFFVATAARPYYLIGLYGVVIAAGLVALQRRREAKPSRWGWTAWIPFLASAALAGYLMWASTSMTTLFGVPSSDLVARDTSAAYTALPPQQQERTAVVGDSYIITAMVEVGRARYDLPEAYSPHRGYGFFGPPDEQVDSVLLVGDPEDLRGHFTDVRQVHAGAVPIWLCTGKIGTWAEIWPRLQHL